MTIEAEVSALTTATTALLDAVNHQKHVIDAAASASATAAENALASEQAASDYLAQFFQAVVATNGSFTSASGEGAVQVTYIVLPDATKGIVVSLHDATSVSAGAMSAEDKIKLDNVQATARVQSVAGREGQVVLTSEDVGLAAFAGLTPATLGVSTATQAALDAIHERAVADALSASAFYGLTPATLEISTATQFFLSAISRDIMLMQDELSAADYLKAPKDSPVFTGMVTVPTLLPGANSDIAASTAYADAAVAAVEARIVNGSPELLNTLSELSLAIANDPNFAAVQAAALGNRLRVDVAAQGLSGVQRANAVANLGLAAVAVSGNRADVGLALVENKSSQTIRAELTSNNVTTALAYTPANRAGDTLNLMGVTNSTLDSTPVGLSAPASGAFTALSVSGISSTTGLTNTGELVQVGNSSLIGTLVQVGNSSLDGTLSVTGISSTTGLTNTGELVQVGNSSLIGTLDVSGQSTTKGLTNTGALVQVGSSSLTGALSVSGISSTTGLTNTGELVQVGNSSLIGTLGVTGQVTSTLPDGTQPLVLLSKTKVANLNADLLDGGDWASPGALGAAVPNSARVTSLEVGQAAQVGGALTVLADSAFNSTGALRLSVGTTAQRPVPAFFGMVRANTDIGWYEAYNGQYWYALGGAPIGTLFALNYTYIGPLADPITSITCTPPAMTPNGVTMDYSSVWASTLVIPPTNVLTTSITFTNLQGITGSLAVTGLVALAALNFPSLTTVVGGYALTGLPALTGIMAPMLDQVGGNFSLADSTAVASASFPMLQRVGGSFSLSKLAGCVSMGFPMLRTVEGNLHMDGLTACIGVNFGSLTEVKGAITASDAAALTALSFPSLERIGTGLTGGNAVTIGPLMAGVTVLEFSAALKEVNGSVFASCALSVGQVNKMLVALARLDGSGGTTAFSNKGVSLVGVCGIPSVEGLTAKTVLQSRGCVVTTN